MLMGIAFLSRIQLILNSGENLCPIRAQGLILLSFSLYLFFGPARTQSDLLAYSISGGLFILIVICVACVVFNYFLIRKYLSLNLIVPLEEVVSQLPVTCQLSVNNLLLSTINYLQLRATFDHDDVSYDTHDLRIITDKTFTCPENFYFFHRGIWHLNSYRVSLGDKLGICKISWTIPLDRRLEVFAPINEISNVQPPTTNTVTGDAFYHNQNFAGDFYDWRQYHPSDGINRILWKIYAHSGQLIVRKPEQTGCTDKQLFLYIIAAKNEDKVISAYRSLVNSIENYDLEIIIGSDGLTYDTPEVELNAPNKILNNLHNLNRLVWHKMAGTGLGLTSFINWMKRNDPYCKSIVILGAEENITNILSAVRTAKNARLETNVLLIPSIKSIDHSTISKKFYFIQQDRKKPLKQLHEENLLMLSAETDKIAFIRELSQS